MRMRTWTSIGVVAALVLTACSGTEPEAADETGELQAVLNEAFAAHSELADVYHRVLIKCMAEAGYEVHSPKLEEPGSLAWGGEEPELPADPPDLTDIPTVAESEENGFGVGQYVPERVRTYEDSDFERMNDEYRDRYYRDLYGGDVVDNLSDDVGGFTQDDGGQTVQDLDQTFYMMADMGRGSEADWESGGCHREVTDAIFAPAGDVDEVPDYTRGLPGLGYKPDVFAGGRSMEEYESAVFDVRQDWSKCVADRGHDYIELETYAQSVRTYVELFYWSKADYLERVGGGPNQSELADSIDEIPVPDGAPWPHEVALEHEMAYAVDAAECADEVELRANLSSEWDATFDVVADEFESQVYAWHDAVRESLGKAQAVLSELNTSVRSWDTPKSAPCVIAALR